MPREATASKIQTAAHITATYSLNTSTFFCQYIPAGGKREYVRKNNLEKIKPQLWKIKSITKCTLTWHLERLSPLKNIGHTILNWAIWHMDNTYERTNNIGIIIDQTHSQMRRLELAWNNHYKQIIRILVCIIKFSSNHFHFIAAHIVWQRSSVLIKSGK